MLPANLYHPILFYSIVLISTIVLCPIAYHLSTHDNLKRFLFPLILLGIALPGVTALVFILSNNHLTIDFLSRVFLFNIDSVYYAWILFSMPGVVLLATSISLLFGYQSDQFFITKEISVMKGWSLCGMLIPLLIAPMIEELGWRGYGVDCLRAHHNLFITSVLFGIFWSVWHLPTFFIKGYYQNDLLKLNKIYAINFFISVFVMSFIFNWVFYKTNRSIPALVIYHALSNLSFILLRTEQFTKCIATVLMALITIGIMVIDMDYFLVEGLL